MIRCNVLALLLLMLMVPQVGRAVNYTWAADDDGEWTTPANWNSIGYPCTASDNATIRRNFADDITVTLGVPLKINNLLLGNDSGTSRLRLTSLASPFVAKTTLYTGGVLEVGPGVSVTNTTLSLVGTNFVVRLDGGARFCTPSIFSPVVTNATTLFAAPDGADRGGTIDGSGQAWNLAYALSGGKNTAGTNTVWIFDNVTVSNTPLTVSRSPAMNGNTTAVFRNGARMFMCANQDFTIANISTNAVARIEGPGTILTGTGRNLNVSTGAGLNNRMIVTDGARVYDWGHVMMGRTDFSCDNRLEISKGGSLVNPTGSLRICYQGKGTNNVAEVSEGGLVEVKYLWVNYQPKGEVAGNGVIVHDGGVLQFAPSYDISLTSDAFVRIADSTLAFRGTETADVNCNAVASGPGLFEYSGNNAFRLVNAKNVKAATQTYTFAPVVGSPKNWGRLEMVDGITEYRGKTGDTLTIGSDATGSTGSMLCSNTSASVSIPFALASNGTLKMSAATLSLTAGATLDGAVEIDLDRLTVGEGVLKMDSVTLGENSVLRLSGAGTDAVLLASETSIRGAFAAVEGVPAGYSVRVKDKSIVLRKDKGMVIVLF